MNVQEISLPESEREIFSEALTKTTPAERAAFLDVACGQDAALRSRLEQLLSNHFGSDSFMANPFADVSTLLVTEHPGSVIGRYKPLEKIGEGGMGVVYMAEQGEPVRRRVALKIIKAGMDTKSVIARFEAERQALALMEHPNIAKVFDAGSTEGGRPYFVMELVEGLKITDYCAQKNLSVNERLSLFLQVCNAVQHAHQKGIIHRDLKPSNILVSSPSSPSSLEDSAIRNPHSALPKVIDFGIAKAISGRLTDATIHTGLHQFIGTPAYMSPEQADLSPDIDTRTDIYSLGVLLYELLTGKPPFDNQELLTAGLDEMRRIIRDVEPKRPSQSLVAAGVRLTSKSAIGNPQSAIDSDLDCITLKCLDKERSRRYETASALAADILRHLNNEAVLARPQTAIYRFQKTICRHRTLAIAASLVSAALLLGGVTATVFLLRERAARTREHAARQQADRRLNSTLSFVDDIFNQVAPEIRRMPGAVKAQTNLNLATLRMLLELRADAADRPEIREAVAQTLISLATIEGNIGEGSASGQYESALQHANQAIDLFSAIPTADLSLKQVKLVVDAKQIVASSLRGLGRYKESAATLENSQPLLAPLERTPEFAQWARTRRIGNLSDIGLSLILAGQAQEGLNRLLQILKSDWARSITTNSDDWELEVLAGCYGVVTSACEKLGDFHQMLQAAEDGLPYQEFLVRRFPGNTRHQGCLAGFHAIRGFGLVHAGHAVEGFKSLSQGRTEIEALVTSDPANQFALSWRAYIVAYQTRAFAVRSLQPSNLAERAEYVASARKHLAEVEQLTAVLKSEPAKEHLGFARAEFSAAQKMLESAERDHPPPTVQLR